MDHKRVLEEEIKLKTVQLNHAYEKVKNGYIDTVYRLTLAAEYRNKETGDHIKRISLYSRLMAQHIGLPEEKAEEICLASAMHDVGKIGIPDSILLKPGRLSEEEFEEMKFHTEIGANILRGADSGILKVAEEISLTHHERWNGEGYPRGLKGEAIPISGRIVNIVDIYDAMRSRRPYKQQYYHETACEIIDSKFRRGYFDPLVYRTFVDCVEEFDRIFDQDAA
jgi:putative two-component system response regulator